MAKCLLPECDEPVKRKDRIFCSRICQGIDKRGKTKGKVGSNRQKSKYHIRININGERKYLHRYIVEENVRLLEEKEIVHHKDEDKHNNDLDNLHILEGRAKHLHLHNYFRKSKKVIEYDNSGDIPF